MSSRDREYRLLVMSRLLFFLLSIASSEYIAAQGVDRDMIEMLFKVLSPTCREEMDAALVQPEADMSDECKMEIASELEKLNSPPGNREELAGGGVHRSRGKSTSGEALDNPDVIVSFEVISVIIFLVIAFAIVGGYIFYVNHSKTIEMLPKPKKLSKKKVSDVDSYFSLTVRDFSVIHFTFTR